MPPDNPAIVAAEAPAPAPAATVAPAPAPAAPAPSTEHAAPAQAETAPAAAPAVDSSVTAGATAPVEPAAAKPAELAADAAPGREPTLLQKFDADQAATKEAAEKAAAEAGKPKTTTEPPSQDKPAEAAAPKPGEKPAEGAKPAEPLVEVDYYKDVKIPDVIQVSERQRSAVTSALDAIRAGNATEGVQALFDLHATTMSAYAEQLRRDQWDAFAKTRETWRNDVMGDPILGGAGHNTAMGAIARVRDLAVSDSRPGLPQYENDRKEFESFLEVTGAGDHPAFLRFLHRMARYIDEPALPPEGPKPPPNNGARPGDRRGRLYPTMQQRTGS